MTFKERSPHMAPDFALYRENVAATDGATDANKAHGVNMGHYRRAIIDVAPAGGADPSVAVLWWSEKAQKFVQEHTSIAKAGIGADASYQFAVECLGRIMMVKVTAIAAGTVDISVAGYDLDHTL